MSPISEHNFKIIIWYRRMNSDKIYDVYLHIGYLFYKYRTWSMHIYFNLPIFSCKFNFHQGHRQLLSLGTSNLTAQVHGISKQEL